MAHSRPQSPTWSTPMLAKLKAGLCRINETRGADVIGAALVFALPIVVLIIGTIVDGGM
jgi:predicted benzoate:H+ symporter BenE